MRHSEPGPLTLGDHFYKQVKHRILESLRIGEWKPGETIPSEKSLGERYAVSIGTVRKAIGELCAENMLIRQQGRGTFVASHGRGRYFFSFFHIVSQDGRLEFPSVELIEFTRMLADASAASALAIGVGDKVWRFVNRVSLQGQAVLLDEINLPLDAFPRLSERALRQRTSTLYQYYHEHAGVSVIRTRERVRAIKADATRARLLQVQMGHPLLLVLRIAQSYQERPVEFRRSYVNTSLHEYSVDLLGKEA